MVTIQGFKFYDEPGSCGCCPAFHNGATHLNIGDGLTPDEEGAELLREYVDELESFYEDAPTNEDSGSPLAKVHPEWVVEFMNNRYNINHLWI
jgi:hypothetical protein